MDELPFDQIGYWSEIKLDIVRKYATAYSKILSTEKRIRRHLYIDAFAGWGVHISKATGDFVAGSPVNALNVNPPFSGYHFVDLDNKRVEGLQQLAAKRDDVTVYHGDCNEVLLNDVFPLCRYEDYSRALCLLDPYAINVNWQVLAAAGATQSIEVFYNFMIMDANMNVLWHNPDNVRRSQIQRMNAVWGDESWRSAAYRTQKGLFCEIEEKTSNNQVITAFRKRLQKVAGFRYVPEPIPMRNTSGAVVYYLFFASPNQTGSKIVTEIFEKYRSH